MCVTTKKNSTSLPGSLLLTLGKGLKNLNLCLLKKRYLYILLKIWLLHCINQLNLNRIKVGLVLLTFIFSKV